MADLPDGVELAYTHWGEPKSDTSMSLATGSSIGAVSPAHSVVPYMGAKARAKKCKANDDTCNGWRVAGGDLCAAHSGLLKPKRADREPG